MLLPRKKIAMITIIKDNKRAYDFALLISGNRGGGGHYPLEIKKVESNLSNQSFWNSNIISEIIQPFLKLRHSGAAPTPFPVSGMLMTEKG